MDDKINPNNCKFNCEELIKIGRYDEAVNEAKNILKLYHEDYYLQWLMGLAIENSGDTEISINIYKRIIHEHPTYIKAHFSYQSLLERIGKIKELLNIYTEIKYKNETALNLFLFGNIIEDNQEKLDVYQQAINIDPECVWAYIGMVSVLIHIKRYNEAQSTLLKIGQGNTQDFVIATTNRYLGDLYFINNKIDDALSHYNLAVKYDNLDAMSYFMIGCILSEKKGQIKESLSYFMTAANISPFKRTFLLNAGHVLISMNENENGLEFLNRALTAYEKHDVAIDLVLINIGCALYNQGKPQDAIVYFKKALKFNNLNKVALENIGIIYKELGDYEQFRKYFEEYIKVEKNNEQKAEAINIIGETLVEEKQYKDAIKKFKEVTQIVPDNSTLYYNMGVVYIQLGEWKSARDCFNKVIDLNNDPATYKKSQFELAQIYLMFGEYYEALNIANQILEEKTNTDEHRCRALEFVATSFLGIFDYENVIKASEDLKKIDYYNPKAYLNMATARFHQGNYTKAEEHINELLQLTSDTNFLIIANRMLGEIALRKGQKSEAEQIFKRLATLDFSSPLVIEQKGIDCFRKGELKKSEEYFKKNIEIPVGSFYNNKWKAHFYLGKIYTTWGQYDTAIKEFERILDYVPMKGYAHYELAHLYKYLNMKDKAIYHAEEGINCLNENDYLSMIKLELLKIRITYAEQYLEEKIKQNQKFFDEFKMKYGDDASIKHSMMQVIQNFYMFFPLFHQMVRIRDRLLQIDDKIIFSIDKVTFPLSLKNDNSPAILSEFFPLYCQCVIIVSSFRQILRQATEEGRHEIPEINDVLNNINAGIEPLYEKIKVLLSKDEEATADASINYIEAKGCHYKDIEKIIRLYDNAISTYARLNRKYKLFLAKYARIYIEHSHLSGIGEDYYHYLTRKWVSLESIVEKYRVLLKEMKRDEKFFDLRKNCLFRIGEIYFYKRRLSHAKSYLTQAVNLIEKRRQYISNYNQVRAAMFASNTKIYARLIETNYLLNNYEDMLRLINASQNRELFHSLIDAKMTLVLNCNGGQTYKESLKQSGDKEILNNISVSDSIHREFKRTLGQLRKFPRHILPKLGFKYKNVALLEYFYYNDKLFICFMGFDNLQLRVFSIQNHELDILITELLDDTYKVYEQDKRGKVIKEEELISRNQTGKDLLCRVSRILLPDSLIEEMRDYEILIIVPFGRLHHIPFSCLLQTNDEYLFEKWVILQNPSLASFAKGMIKKLSIKKPSMSAFFGIGVKSAVEEYMMIKEIYPHANVYPDFNTEPICFKNNKECFLRYHDESRFMLLYSHFFISPKNLLNSGFYIGGKYITEEAILEDELKLNEIAQKCNFKNTELLIMCGCNSGLADVQFNEFIGASVTFMSKGVPSILASIWPIDPRINKYFTRSFYHRFFKEGKPKYEAFACAQRDLYNEIKKKPEFNHLLYLGPWVLMGNPF